MKFLALALALGGCGADPNPSAPGQDCSVGQTRCQGTVFQTCVAGQFHDQMDCTSPHTAKLCVDALGCVDCRPGDLSCVGNEQHSCNDDGTVGGVVQVCSNSCVGGQCVDACAAAEANRSYIGCEYWAVDLDNAIEVLGPPQNGSCSSYPMGATLNDGSQPICHFPMATQPGSTMGICDYGNDCTASGPPDVFMCSQMPVCVWDAQHAPFAIVVSNPDTETSVGVTLTNKAGHSAAVTIPPGAVLPIFPQTLGFADQSLAYSGIEDKAYKLVASRPIVAYQFNPLNNVDVFSNDASLLLPAHTFERTYHVLTYPTVTRRPNTNDYNGYVTIVASSPGTTMVTVDAKGRVRAGLNVPAFGPGNPQTFALEQYQTLNLEAVGADGNGVGARGDDLSGSVITSDKPIGVFVGHQSSNLSSTSTAQCCTDHLEEQLYPTSAWGKHYAVVRSQPRSTSQPDLVRILAFRPNTQVTITPAQPTPCPTLDAGQLCEFFFEDHLEITSTEPVLVGHLITSSGSTQTDERLGDPSLSLAVPIEQYRKQYAFLIPDAYMINYVSLVVPRGQRATLDGMDVSNQLLGFGSGDYLYARIHVDPGAHRIDCPGSCGIEVTGWSIDVSYMFAGGMDLNQLVVP